jgi:hypothetical protein
MTKLLLDKDMQPTGHDDPTLPNIFGDGMLLLPHGKRAETVCADYLRGMYRYLVSVLKKRFSEQIFDVTPIECWLALPANWSDNTTALTKQAVANAGFATARAFDTVNIVKELEAAALTVLKPHMEEITANQVK